MHSTIHRHKAKCKSIEPCEWFLHPYRDIEMGDIEMGDIEMGDGGWAKRR